MKHPVLLFDLDGVVLNGPRVHDPAAVALCEAFECAVYDALQTEVGVG